MDGAKPRKRYQMVKDNFAAGYLRNEQGWILFPLDKGKGPRQDLFPPEAMRHPAKYNFAMVESIIEYVSEPGDTIMDVMAGTGTIMIGALLDRNIVCIELEKAFCDMMVKAKDIIGIATNRTITILCGDCRDFMPIPVNHIIFSPPYAMILKSKKPMDDEMKEKWKTMAYSHGHQEDYSKSPRNVGNLNRFMYNQAMERIYKLCYDSIIPGGTLTVVLKDYVEQGKRVYLSEWLVRTCVGFGFENIAWFKREATGSGYQDVWRSKGYMTIDDEDIVVSRKNK
jgi:DNA modification methylase